MRRPIYTSSLEGGLLASDLRVAADLRSAFEEVFYQYEARRFMRSHMHTQVPGNIGRPLVLPIKRRLLRVECLSAYPTSENMKSVACFFKHLSVPGRPAEATAAGWQVDMTWSGHVHVYGACQRYPCLCWPEQAQAALLCPCV